MPPPCPCPGPSSALGSGPLTAVLQHPAGLGFVLSPQTSLSLLAAGGLWDGPLPHWSCHCAQFLLPVPHCPLTVKRKFSAPGAANLYPIYLLAFHCSRFKCIRLERNTRNEPKLERNIKIQQKIEYEYNPVLETSASTSFTFCKYLYNRQIHGSTDSYLPTHRIA